MIVVENRPTAKRPARPSHKSQAARQDAGLGLFGWLRGLGQPVSGTLAR
jgi:hypothetical protein